jgi:hypothetical protein
MNAVLKPTRYLSRQQLIQQRARYLQLELWNRRAELWTHEVPQSPLDVLQPGVGLKLAGFEIESRDFLGDEWDRGVHTEVAGLLDRDLGKVFISTRQSRVVQNFTAAHELGHALLHPHVDVKHRELPMDGPRGRSSWEEREADWFATEFLMPEKQVRKEFANRFGEAIFHLTDATAYALCGCSLEKVLLRCRSPRDLSKILAETPTYNGRTFPSMAGRFSVSSKAMAIRIDELRLSAFM